MTLTKREVLEHLDIGKGVAEQETDNLENYFIETNQWKRFVSGDADIVLGPKGSGKSAIYALIKNHENMLLDRGIDIIPAEKPQGQPVFRLVRDDPPKNEDEFTAVWKLYFVVLIVEHVRINHLVFTSIRQILEDEHLIDAQFTLRRALKASYDYVRKFLGLSSIEGGLSLDPVTGTPSGVTGKITFREISSDERRSGKVSVDDLLDDIDGALRESDRKAWIILDRLDVVFETEQSLERMALRSLFRVYKDMFEYRNISVKIFLRTDIWNKISEGGFREASHLANNVELSWTKKSMIHLIAERLVFSNKFCEYYNLDADEIKRDFNKQQSVVDRIFPAKIIVFDKYFESGIGWILYNIKDGRGIFTPRELIEMMNFTIQEEIARLERGEPEYGGQILFNVEAMHKSIRRLSKLRLEQTIYAEYPDLKKLIEPLSARKRHRFEISDLQVMWELDRTEAQTKARALSEVGFFRIEQANQTYIIPHLYGFALGIGGTDPNKKRTAADQQARS